jgi:hypothetical protein
MVWHREETVRSGQETRELRCGEFTNSPLFPIERRSFPSILLTLT